MMSDVEINADREWLLTLASERFHPVVVNLDTHNRVIDIVGNLDYFGFRQPQAGELIGDAFDFMYGMEEPFDSILEFIETPNGCAVHAYLQARDHGRRLTLIDVTEERDQRQSLQQKSNELALLNQEQVKLLNELGLVNEALSEKKIEAENLANLQSQFLASMSHEFRTPLASILTFADYLQSEHGKDASQEGLGSIKRAAQHLLNMVENLIGQAQLSLEGLQLNPSPTDMRLLAEELSSLFMPLTAAKGLAFSVEYSNDLPRYLVLDPVRFKQVCINLLGNACKYTDRGEVKLKFSQLDRRLCVAISDTGQGIPDSAQQKIFKAFERGAQSDSKGAGLGLHIVEQLVTLMNGQVSFDSRPGIGTTVSIELPLPETDETAQNRPLVSDETDAPGENPPQKVLVVEDDSDVYDILAIYLDDAGYEVYHADSGLAAFDIVEQVLPDAVISDLNVPDLDGASLTQRLRENQFAGPIVILTASDLRRDRERAEQAGCSNYLVKPVSADTLIATLSRVAH